VSREWRVVIRPKAETAEHDLALVQRALRNHAPKFDFERDGYEFFVYVDAPHSPLHEEKSIMAVLADQHVARSIPWPLRAELWNETRQRYVDSTEPEEPEPAVAPDEVGWVVAVEPKTAFDWRPTRGALLQLRRTIIRETARTIDVGARDADDADALRATLADIPFVGETLAKPLSWVQRWRAREFLLGNYSGPGDPTQSW
jgi:hypothetical protein